MEREEKAGRNLFVLEAALLFEAGYEDLCQEVWAVHADREVRIQRLMESRGYTREKALAIMAEQLPEEEFLSRADRVLMNNGSPQKVYDQAKVYLAEILKQDPEEER
jgi:dephospho-CoA kinase